MALFASLADSRIVTAHLTIPAYGCWVADVRLAEDDALPAGALPLILGNLSLVGSVVRSGPFAGARGARVVGGFGGWKEPVTARHYGLTSGVRLATVIRDAAAEVGESVTIAATDDRSVGPFYVRAAGPASRVLAALVGREGWYVDAAGVTRLGDRPQVAITTEFDIPTPGYRPEAGLVTIATEDPVSWQPGAIFEHELLNVPLQVASASFVLAANGRLRVEVMANELS